MARRAKEAGSTRFCMGKQFCPYLLLYQNIMYCTFIVGAAWRDVGETKDRKAFSSVLEMVRQVSGMGLEVCCTLGMLTLDQAKQLKDAGLTAYNHNLDTSREFYPQVRRCLWYPNFLSSFMLMHHRSSFSDLEFRFFYLDVCLYVCMYDVCVLIRYLILYWALLYCVGYYDAHVRRSPADDFECESCWTFRMQWWHSRSGRGKLSYSTVK